MQQDLLNVATTANFLSSVFPSFSWENLHLQNRVKVLQAERKEKTHHMLPWRWGPVSNERPRQRR